MVSFIFSSGLFSMITSPDKLSKALLIFSIIAAIATGIRSISFPESGTVEMPTKSKSMNTVFIMVGQNLRKLWLEYTCFIFGRDNSSENVR